LLYFSHIHRLQPTNAFSKQYRKLRSPYSSKINSSNLRKSQNPTWSRYPWPCNCSSVECLTLSLYTMKCINDIHHAEASPENNLKKKTNLFVFLYCALLFSLSLSRLSLALQAHYQQQTHIHQQCTIHVACILCRVSIKEKATIFHKLITSSNTDQFSKLFHRTLSNKVSLKIKDPIIALKCFDIYQLVSSQY